MLRCRSAAGVAGSAGVGWRGGWSGGSVGEDSDRLGSSEGIWLTVAKAFDGSSNVEEGNRPEIVGVGRSKLR